MPSPARPSRSGPRAAGTTAVNIWSACNPRGTSRRATKLRISSPAPINSVRDSATSSTTTASRSRLPRNPPLVPLPLSRRGSLRSRRNDCNAGARPHIRAVSTAMPSVTMSTGAFSSITDSDGITRRERGHERLQPTPGEEDPQRGSGHRQHQALDDEQPDDSRAPRPQHGPQGELFLSHRRARQHQVCHVAARNQEQQSYRRQYRVQRRADSLDHRVAQPAHVNGEVPRVLSPDAPSPGAGR